MPPTLLTSKQRNKLAWALNIALVVFFTINSLGTCIVAALMGKEWEQLTATTRFMIVVVIGVNWSTMMMAFLNRRLSDLLGGEAKPTQQSNQTLPEPT